MYGGLEITRLAGTVLAAFLLAAIADLYGLELVLVAVAVLVARHSARFGESWFTRVETFGARLAERKVAAAALVGASALVIRLALLPVHPVPHPIIPDEFSHLLLADTLAHGRLTNPAHPMWHSFETLHVLQLPSYNSMYFPGPALLLLLGKLLTGLPWIGLLLGTSALCGLICWALQAYLPARWALLGGLVAVLKFGLVSYWVDSYWGGTFAALGGTLVLGALPRLERRPTVGMSVLTALGIGMLANSRPYEGVWLCVPVGVRLTLWLFEKTKGPSLGGKIARVAIPMALVLATVGMGMGIYFKSVTGDPFRLPYVVNEERYGWPMTLPWTDLRLVKHERPEFGQYYLYELGERMTFTSPGLFLGGLVLRIQQDWRFYAGPALTIPLLFFWRIYRSPRLRFLLVAGAVVMFGVYMEPHFPHYMAPITLVAIGVQVQGFRYLRRSAPAGRAVGLRLSRAIPVILIAMVACRVAASAVNIPYQKWGGYTSWCCSNGGNVDREAVARTLPASGKHLILVHYRGNHKFLEEWVYNGADIDGARVIWAREWGGEQDKRLRQYFHDRQIWSFSPEMKPWRLVPLGDR